MKKFQFSVLGGLAAAAVVATISVPTFAESPRTAEQICGSVQPQRENLIVICEIWKKTVKGSRQITVLPPNELFPPLQCNCNPTSTTAKEQGPAQADALCKQKGFDGVQAWDAGFNTRGSSWKSITCYKG